jgi:single-stranded-DNA-specific exonuclease
VAPLDGDNRILVHAGLAALGSPARPGLRALLDRLRRGRQRPVTADDVGYQIGPRLNAPGRLGDPTVALELLLADDPVRAAALAAELDAIGAERRQLQATMVAEALADVAAGGYGAEPAVLVARAGWHPGIVGIVAGRLAAELGRPTAVVALDGDRGRGSARAPAGFPLYDSLAASAERLLGFGGHQAAAGLELRVDDVPAFRRDWAAACAAIAAAPERWLPIQTPPRVALDPRDDLQQVVADLERLEPCGHGNPTPLIVLSDVAVRSVRELQGHLRLDLALGGRAIGAFAPNRGADGPGLSGSRLEVVGKLRRDHFRGGDAVELLVEELTR